MQRNDAATLDLKEKVVTINRVSKTVKGGRVSKFAVLVVVGDGKGRVGVGHGKASEVPDAKKNMLSVEIKGTTVPHEVIGKFGAGSVLIKPAAPGTGIIAGGAVRAVMEAAGITDVRAKSLRSNNPNNVVYATIEGLKQMRNVEAVAKRRGKAPEEILG